MRKKKINIYRKKSSEYIDKKNISLTPETSAAFEEIISSATEKIVSQAIPTYFENAFQALANKASKISIYNQNTAKSRWLDAVDNRIRELNMLSSIRKMTNPEFKNPIEDSVQKSAYDSALAMASTFNRNDTGYNSNPWKGTAKRSAQVFEQELHKKEARERRERNIEESRRSRQYRYDSLNAEDKWIHDVGQQYGGGKRGRNIAHKLYLKNVIGDNKLLKALEKSGKITSTHIPKIAKAIGSASKLPVIGGFVKYATNPYALAAAMAVGLSRYAYNQSKAHTEWKTSIEYFGDVGRGVMGGMMATGMKDTQARGKAGAYEMRKYGLRFGENWDGFITAAKAGYKLPSNLLSISYNDFLGTVYKQTKNMPSGQRLFILSALGIDPKELRGTKLNETKGEGMTFWERYNVLSNASESKRNAGYTGVLWGNPLMDSIRAGVGAAIYTSKYAYELAQSEIDFAKKTPKSLKIFDAITRVDALNGLHALSGESVFGTSNNVPENYNAFDKAHESAESAKIYESGGTTTTNTNNKVSFNIHTLNVNADDSISFATSVARSANRFGDIATLSRMDTGIRG